MKAPTFVLPDVIETSLKDLSGQALELAQWLLLLPHPWPWAVTRRLGYTIAEIRGRLQEGQ